ncbi:MAG: ADP-ribosylglycohydrolase family protein [Pirellulales bacterium]|nr:ADP-ribosylglycohydrolase family protein [Pirellulales bacterium]
MTDRLLGILLGTAVGDALGLPAEGLSPRRRRRLLPGPWRHRFLLGRGMVSDDTEHALFVAQSLLKHPADPSAFQRSLGWHLRWWFLGLPAGIGLATARACAKLCLRFPPSRSGVFSAGNGPAMRSAILGGYFHDDPQAAEAFVRASTEITHTDPKAMIGALAVARMAAWGVAHDPSHPPSIEEMSALLMGAANGEPQWSRLVCEVKEAFAADTTVSEFAAILGLKNGVTGYVFHTVPVAAYAWLRHFGDFRSTVEAVLDCGGDTDTVGAIAGALAGATVGAIGIPQTWLEGIVDWPRSVGLLQRVAERLAQQREEGRPLGPVTYCWPAVLPRNLLFLAAVLAHGFRRLAPPY